MALTAEWHARACGGERPSDDSDVGCRMSRDRETADELIRLNLSRHARREILMAEEDLTIDEANAVLAAAEREAEPPD
jgi:hypothetical protein